MRRVAAVCAAAGVVLAGVLAVGLLGGPHEPHQTQSVRIGGPFSLLDAGGHTVTDASFRGKWMLVYFGYTHCPDACPTALNAVGNALDMLHARAGDVAPIFITVDPSRDTPSLIGAYTRQFSPAIIGLTGSQAAIDQAEREYRVYAAKHPTPDGGYGMDHSNVIYVMDPRGRFSTIIDGGANPEDIAAKIGQLEG